GEAMPALGLVLVIGTSTIRRDPRRRGHVTRCGMAAQPHPAARPRMEAADPRTGIAGPPAPRLALARHQPLGRARDRGADVLADALGVAGLDGDELDAAAGPKPALADPP